MGRMAGRGRTTLLAAAAAVVALGLAACNGQSAAPGGQAGGEQPYVAIVSKGFQHQFWQAVKSGAEEQATKEGVRITFEGPDTETNVAQQVDQLNAAMANNPQALAVAALDSQAAAPLLQQAQDRKIPVVAFDSGVDSEIPVSTVATDNSAAAAAAAENMAGLIGGKGKVAVIAHDQTSTSGRDRRDGFVEWMKQNAPDVEIVDIQYGGGDQLKSTDLAKAIISANPDLKGIYGTNEGSAIGVVNAVKETGVSGLTVVGFDSGKAQTDAIRSGVMAGAVTQNPVGIGQKTVEIAAKAIRGEAVEPFVDTGFYWYDKNNIDDPEIAANLYE
ncbi:ABC transporter substrate-binding protein [Naumannella cuiyingiana]|uniref:Ribose transport system substrate-binding protein n=1 Tax=Naumannella cuiyingiana TaxID=1347891 RepID=A0A7Z0DBV7_9ACTN|nr:ABC transporter substrate-binding protein [Naumannella cuiyingiana]NYI72448.1 ribose transport system substrate-binding protein [Naumannella cuiyingiana]